MFLNGWQSQKAGCRPSIRSRGPRCTTGPPSHCGCGPQSSLEGGSPVSRTLYDVWIGLQQRGELLWHDTAASSSFWQNTVVRWHYGTLMALWFLTLEKVHGRTNQNQQFSALHDSQEADSLAWCHDESLSSHGSTSAHRISPPCTGNVKRHQIILHVNNRKLFKIF